MIDAVKRTLVGVLTAAIVSVGLPHPAPGAPAAETIARGTDSADEAAAPSHHPAPPSDSDRAVDTGAPILAYGAMAAFDDPDTTEFQFPEENKRSIVKDITVWVIASAFVAFFIIKVFLEKDKDEPVDKSPPGKKI